MTHGLRKPCPTQWRMECVPVIDLHHTSDIGLFSYRQPLARCFLKTYEHEGALWNANSLILSGDILNIRTFGRLNDKILVSWKAMSQENMTKILVAYPLFCFVFLWDGILLCSPGCPVTHYIAKAGLKVTENFFLQFLGCENYRYEIPCSHGPLIFYLSVMHLF